MTEQELTALLERAAARTPVKAVPWDEIVSEGQGQLTNRRPLLLASVVTVTALAVVGVVVTEQTLGGLRSDEAPLSSPSSSASDLPEVPSGMRLVGKGRIVVAVSETWTTEVGGCYDLPLQNRVFFPSDKNPSCAGVRPPNTSSVQFYDSRSRSVTGLVNEAVVPAEINGVSVLSEPTQPTGGAGVVEGVIVVPSEHLLVWVDSPDEEVVTGVLNSITNLPEGYIAIPSAEGTWEATRNAMLEAGLEVSVTRTDVFFNGVEAGDVVKTVPAIGSVVEDGSSVAITVAGFTKADWNG